LGLHFGGGYVPCPLAPIRNDPERSARHFAHVDALLDRPLFISTEHLLCELPQSVAAMHLDALRTRVAEPTVHQAALWDAAVLMLTSGSTGNSKAVELTHGNVLASMAGRAERLELTCADITLNWIAFDHVAALMESHMIAVYVGANQVHADPIAMVADPLQFLRLIDRHRVSLAFAPNFFLAQINGALQTSEMSDRIDLSCLRRIVTGGEANVVETGKRFLDLLAQNVLWPAFGMTETCAASVYSQEFPDRDLNREFGAVGLPINGLEVRIVDDHGALQVGEPGELQLRGPVIFRRYYNNEEATRAAFTSDGWFRTGDVGRMDDGRLILVARIKDSIIVNGINYFSHEIETQLEQLNGIERSFVAAFATRPKGADTEQLIVAFSPAFQSDEEQLYRLVVAVRNAVVMLWGFSPTLVLPLRKVAFPRTSLGKIQRSLMRKRFEAGDFAASVDHITGVISRQLGPHIPPADSLEVEIAQVCCEILGIDLTSLSATANFFDLDATSIKILRLTHALEQRFGLEGALPIVLRNPSVRGLAQRISAKKRGEVGEYDPVVSLQATGKKTPPLFCVHPGEGDILVWVNLARCFLNDRPIYALLAPGFSAGEERFKSFDEIVSTHVSAILRCQPRGPYLLAGYATGVNIVFEIAKELEARGYRVAFFGCVDWMPTEQASPGAPYGFLATGLAFALGFISLAQWNALCGNGVRCRRWAPKLGDSYPRQGAKKCAASVDGLISIDMTATMAHRGPDDEGSWIDGPVALGHRRLAIIDIEGGRQPMTLQEDGRPALVLVYTGETYNYRELRQRLAAAGHRFDTSSDTEVVLHAHREWGRRDPRTAVSELNGMFAYALWDTAKRELTLVRDRLGIKPLYYYATEHGVLFGSEPKAILANGLAERVVDADGLRRALSFVANPHNAVFRGMREVPPGHVVRVTRDGVQQLTYWQLTDSGHTDDVPTTVLHVCELLEDTTQRQLISDVPLCTLLSGGLDSSALTALAARFSHERIRSFALDFVGYTDNFTPGPMRDTPDGPYVQEVAKFVGTDHTDITLSAGELMDPDVRVAIHHAYDLPITWGDLDSSLYLLFRAIRQHSTVVLSGESADEVFGGYPGFHDPAHVQADTFPWFGGRENINTGPQYMDPGLVGKLDLLGYLDDQYRRALAEVPALTGPASADPHERRMREVCYLFLTRHLPMLLDRKDRVSMALGLEVRVPYCDHRLVAYVFGTPWAHKTFDGREKSLLRAATADLLPQSVVQRVKSAYPSIQDPTYDRMLRTRFTALLTDRNAAGAPLLSIDGSHALLNATDNVRWVEHILTLEDFLTDYNVTLMV